MSYKRLWTGVNPPYNTTEGGKWLSKALDPSSIRTDVGGLPDTNSANVCVLNYQTQDNITPLDVSTTAAVNAEYTSYDADLLLYQHPIYMGCSASYLSDTTDPSRGAMSIDAGYTSITIGGAVTCGAANEGTFSVSFTPADHFSSAVFAPRTVSLIKNEQIPGRNYTDQQEEMADFCQRYRMIYGGTQVIPACSDNYNSGTIEACQQVFNAGQTTIATMDSQKSGDDRLQSFMPTNDIQSMRPGDVSKQGTLLVFNDDDFPNSSDIVQNPQGLLCRYREGVFMPYKIVNPLNHPYLVAEEKKLISAPFWVTGASAVFYTAENIANHDFQTIPTDQASWEPLVWDRATNSFRDSKSGENSYTHPYASNFMGWVAIHCVSFLGLPFKRIYYMPSVKGLQATQKVVLQGQAEPVALANGNIVTIHATYNTPDALGVEGSESRYAFDTLPIGTMMPVGGNLGTTYKAEAGQAAVNILNITDNANHPLPGKTQVISANRVELIQTTDARETEELNFIDNGCVFPQHSRIGVINFRSISTTAGMKMLLRLGTEITLSSGTIYSMFKHRSPSYDEAAIKAYLRCIHEMKDAYFGDAASEAGHDEYAATIRAMVWASPDREYVTTQGSRFQGAIGA